MDQTRDETYDLLASLLDIWPDDRPLPHFEAPAENRVPDSSHLPPMPWVAYLVLPLDDWRFEAPEVEALEWIEAPVRADSAMRPVFEGWETRAFAGPTPADAFVAAQRNLKLTRRGLR